MKYKSPSKEVPPVVRTTAATNDRLILYVIDFIDRGIIVGKGNNLVLIMQVNL